MRDRFLQIRQTFGHWLLLAMVLSLAGCVTVDPRESKNVRASKINVQLGIGYMQQNNLEVANEKLLKALRQNPKSAAAHNAYAMLQDRLLQKDKAEYHYKRATKLDRKDSQAANNYGTFLCRNNRVAEAEKYFLRALKNPLYKTPEFAYTNAALCLLKIDKNERAKDYLRKALAARSNFPTALIAMGRLVFEQDNFSEAKIYLDRFHRVANPTATSLWLAIRTELELNSSSDVDALTENLESNFPDSDEYQSWLKTQ
ncbi:MAG: type IV pilus biogenesis/stability protein PilW [Gammaproteobacteria bacterium]